MSIRKNNTVTLKRGDSFVFTNNTLLDDAGNPINLTGWSIRSQVRDRESVLIEELIVQVGELDYSVSSSGTTEWPIETLFWDVEYTTPEGIIFSSDTIAVKVTQDITY